MKQKRLIAILVGANVLLASISLVMLAHKVLFAFAFFMAVLGMAVVWYSIKMSSISQARNIGPVHSMPAEFAINLFMWVSAFTVELTSLEVFGSTSWFWICCLILGFAGVGRTIHFAKSSKQSG